MRPINFKIKEFACKCGCGYGSDICDVDADLFNVLQDVRLRFGSPVIISSGLRCEKHNKDVGGAPSSRHLIGQAADIKVVGVSPKEVHKYLTTKYPEKFGIGAYNTFTHIDVRPNKARW